MSKHSIESLQDAAIDTDPLMQLLRNGAQQLILTAVGAEFRAFMSQYSGHHTPCRQATVVRNGHQPSREIQTGIGPVTVRNVSTCLVPQRKKLNSFSSFQCREVDRAMRVDHALLIQNRIDIDSLWRRSSSGWLADKALRMFVILRVQGSLSGPDQCPVFPGKDLYRGVSGQCTMAMVVVVPVHIIGAPLSGLVVVRKSPWIVRLVFEGLELALAMWVVVANPRAAMTGLNAQLPE